MRNKIIIFIIPLLLIIKCGNDKMDISNNDLNFFEFKKKVESISDNTEKQKIVKKFMKQVKKVGTPIIKNDSTVIFLYYGDKDSVGLLGDMNNWTKSTPFQKIAGTKLFYLEQKYETSACLVYLLQFDSKTFPSIDPLNLLGVPNGFGQNSVVMMPKYKMNHLFDNYIHGEIGDFSRVKEFTIPSKIMNYDHKIHVYLPPKYSEQKIYSTIYFQDGADYITYAHVPFILDTLIKSKKIQPVIAVFVTPPNLHEPKMPNRMTEYGLNDDYIKFFCDELVTYIDKKYSTIMNAEDRLVIGDSYGGLVSVNIAFQRPEIFKKVYDQSGYLSIQNDHLINLINSTDVKDVEIYITVGTYERNVAAFLLPESETDFLMANRRLRNVLENKGYKYKYFEYPEGHTWSNWRKHLVEALEYFFGI